MRTRPYKMGGDSHAGPAPRRSKRHDKEEAGRLPTTCIERPLSGKALAAGSLPKRPATLSAGSILMADVGGTVSRASGWFEALFAAVRLDPGGWRVAAHGGGG